ncbi:unnamed protein product [Brassica oleracea var. botrytis]
MNTSVLVRTSISTHDFGIGITRAPHLFLAFYPLEGLSNYHSAAELLKRKKTILDGTRSKQSFIFADAPVLLLFEEVPESRNFIPKVTRNPSQSVERGIHDNSNRPSNHVMLESLSGTVTEPSDIPISSDMSSAESAQAVCALSAKKPHHG